MTYNSPFRLFIGIVQCYAVLVDLYFHLLTSISAWGLDVGVTFAIELNGCFERLGLPTVLEVFKRDGPSRLLGEELNSP